MPPDPLDRGISSSTGKEKKAAKQRGKLAELSSAKQRVRLADARAGTGVGPLYPLTRRYSTFKRWMAEGHLEEGGQGTRRVATVRCPPWGGKGARDTSVGKQDVADVAEEDTPALVIYQSWPENAEK